MLSDWWQRLLAWWEYDEVLAVHARRAYIRQQMDQHPAERGDNWR